MSTQIDAYLFAVRRQTYALMRGEEPDGPHPLVGRDRALLAGAVLAALWVGAVRVAEALA